MNNYTILKARMKKFFYSRKGKFRLKMQEVYNTRGRFLDIIIEHNRSISNYLAFTISKLHVNLKIPRFLALTLVLFSSNTYNSTLYIVAPCKSASAESKDAYFSYIMK